MDRFGLDGKVALVTGATTGIGRAAALALAEAGADIAAFGRSKNPEEVCQAVRGLGRDALALQGDITNQNFVEESFQQVLDRWGHCDILVNNAGMTVRTPAVDFAPDDWDKIISLNLTALFRMCQRVGRHMIEQRRGKIINIASIASFIGGLRIPAYTASKGGVAQLTKALANEWAPFNVNVNALAPGYIQTEMTEALFDDPIRSRELLSRIPAERWGTPEDLTGAIIFLASPASDFVHGHVLVVDGGWMAR